MYTPAVAAALSGATPRQLSYWRRGVRPLVAPQQERVRGRVYYSFQDVVALRTVVYLRRPLSLQKVRKAVENLRGLGAVEHLSAYRLVASGRSVVWVEGDSAVELTQHVGQQVIAEMVDILGSFTDDKGRSVRPLAEPEPGLTVDANVRAGYPVIQGTRIPYDLVAALLADGVSPEGVQRIYPTVAASAAEGALAFAARVDSKQRTDVA